MKIYKKNAVGKPIVQFQKKYCHITEIRNKAHLAETFLQGMDYGELSGHA
jgi:hypothetical protein